MKTKKIFVAAGSLLLGLLMPYLSRVPLAFAYGAPWIWKFIDNFGDFIRWNGFHLLSLIPLAGAGAFYVYTNLRWCFYAAVFGHFAVTILIFYNFMEIYQRDDFLGCIIFPYLIGFAAIAGGLTGLFAELFFNRRQLSENQIKTVRL